MKLDRKKLKTEVKAVAVEIKRLKKLQRESGQPNYTLRDIYALASKKREANLLCTILAHSHGRLHRKWTMEEQTEWLGKTMQPYVLPEPAVESAAA